MKLKERDGYIMDNENMAARFDSAACALCNNLYLKVKGLPSEIKAQAQEIRLRVNRPLAVYCKSKMYYITTDGKAVTAIYNGKMAICTKKDISDSFRNICGYSVYSYQSEIVNGFITMSGGHRAGICGTAVYGGGKIENIKNISSINIRIARQIFGSADMLINKIGTDFNGLLLCGAPSCGKTTVLRDFARQLSVRFGLKVAVVDERGEIGGTHLGICRNDLGQSDVLDGYKKGEGIMQALRCLSPDVIICDEAGTGDDVRAIEEGVNAGVKIAASIHASGREELMLRPQAKALLSTGAFDRIVFFKGKEQAGEIKEIINTEELLNGTHSRSRYNSNYLDMGRLCSVTAVNRQS